jgi:hypothetical protein
VSPVSQQESNERTIDRCTSKKSSPGIEREAKAKTKREKENEAIGAGLGKREKKERTQVTQVLRTGVHSV